MNEEISILPVIFRLMQGQTLSIDECQHEFFKKATCEGILVVNKRDGTIKEKKHQEDRYYYSKDKYGLTLLNFTYRYFGEHEDQLLIKYWEKLHEPNVPNRDKEPDIVLNEKDVNSITLLGKVQYVQESTWSATKGTMVSIETRVHYTKLDGRISEDRINTKCIIPGKEYREIEKIIPENTIALIKGFFRPEKGLYRFFDDEGVDIIISEYVGVVGDAKDLESEDGDGNFFIDRNEINHRQCLNKVLLTGIVSNIGFKVTRGYPHITIFVRTKIDDHNKYIEIPVEIWEKHHNDCLRDINLGVSITIEGYFKHPISKKYYYWYEPVDATVFAYRYEIGN